MKDEILDLETAQKLADYEKLKKEHKELKEKYEYYRSEWQNVIRMVVVKNRIINELKKQLKKKV